MLKVTRNFNALHAYNSSKVIYLTPINNLEPCIRTIEKFFSKNFLEAKRMQVFPSNLQDQKVLSDSFKK